MLLYRVRNCSQEILAETCNLSLLQTNPQDMQLVYKYIASSNHILVIGTGESSIVTTTAMNPRVGRRQYLVTYSQPDEFKFSSRESFGAMLEAKCC